MQNSIFMNDALQVRPVGIDIEEGAKALKSVIGHETSRLWHTQSETFTAICDETVPYGDVVKAIAGMARSSPSCYSQDLLWKEVRYDGS